MEPLFSHYTDQGLQLPALTYVGVIVRVILLTNLTKMVRIYLMLMLFAIYLTTTL